MLVHDRLNGNIGLSLQDAKCKNCMRSSKKSETAS